MKPNHSKSPHKATHNGERVGEEKGDPKLYCWTLASVARAAGQIKHTAVGSAQGNVLIRHRSAV